MELDIEKYNKQLQRTDKKGIRKEITDFEEMLKGVEGSETGDSHICPLKHSFSDNIYVREIAIPMGTVVVGKIHKHKHPNFLMSGVVEVVTEEGKETLFGPCSMISPAGTKRALYAVTDLVWITVHHNPTNTQDLDEIEKIVIAPSYQEYDKFLKEDKSLINRLKRVLIKKLSV